MAEVVRCARCGASTIATVVHHKGYASFTAAGWTTIMGNDLQNCVFPSCSEECSRAILAKRVSPRFAGLWLDAPDE